MHYANGVLPLCTITRRENGTGPYIPTLQLGIKRVLGNETRYFFLDLCEACLVFSVEDRGSDKLTNAMEFIGIEATRGARCRTNANAAGYEGRALFVGDGVLVHRQAHGLQEASLHPCR